PRLAEDGLDPPEDPRLGRHPVRLRGREPPVASGQARRGRPARPRERRGGSRGAREAARGGGRGPPRDGPPARLRAAPLTPLAPARAPGYTAPRGLAPPRRPPPPRGGEPRDPLRRRGRPRRARGEGRADRRGAPGEAEGREPAGPALRRRGAR